MIYSVKPATQATNLLLRQCGSDLMKLSSENSGLHQERVELLEKVAELTARVSAFEKASAKAIQGKIPASRINLEVAELLNEAPSVVGLSEMGGFAEPIQKTSHVSPKKPVTDPELLRLRNFFKE